VFDLTLDDTVEHQEGAPFYRGRIRLAGFEENFLAAASLWSPDRYRQQWKAAATSLASGASRTAFITSFVHPDATNVLWPAWRVGRLVYIQNHLSLPEKRRGLLTPEAVAIHVGDRVSAGDSGPISEWVVLVSDIAAFAA
jgi:hypothetical protein